MFHNDVLEEVRHILATIGRILEQIARNGYSLRACGPRAPQGGRMQGPDPQRRSYFSFASFRDPDGNSWMLQEIKQRLPCR